MFKKNYRIVLLLLVLSLTIFTIIKLSHKTINLTKNEGVFSQIKSETIVDTYKIRTNDGFFASLDFTLNAGRVDWEILNPQKKVVFSGYVIKENGDTFRQLTYPMNNLNRELNKKEVPKQIIDANGNRTNLADFNYLQFEVSSPPGTYSLNLHPINAEGSYTITWSDSLTKK